MNVRGKSGESLSKKWDTLQKYLDGIDEACTGRGEEGVFPAKQDWSDIFNTITDMITVHDSNFNIIHANKAAEKLLKLPLLNVTGAKCFEYYHGSESPPEGCPSCRCLRTRKAATFEMYEPHLGMYIEIRAIPRFDENNRVKGLIHIVRDITKRKLSEEELDIHRNHLQWLVRERTSEITAINEQLQREIAERRQAEMQREAVINKLKDAISNIKTLSGLLPICAWCKKIRDDGGYWQQVEAYVSAHSEAEFTHAICPECMSKLEDEVEGKKAEA